MIRQWAVRVLIAANQAANALIGGDPQMSMSARAGFAREHGSKLGTYWCATFDLFDRHHPNVRYPLNADHCTIAVIDYRLRKGDIE